MVEPYDSQARRDAALFQSALPDITNPWRFFSEQTSKSVAATTVDTASTPGFTLPLSRGDIIEIRDVNLEVFESGGGNDFTLISAQLFEEITSVNGLVTDLRIPIAESHNQGVRTTAANAQNVFGPRFQRFLVDQATQLSDGSLIKSVLFFANANVFNANAAAQTVVVGVSYFWRYFPRGVVESIS